MYMRYPRTAQEKRANIECKWNRARRNPVNLPEDRDDTWIRYQRNWKKYRRTQYLPKIDRVKRDSTRYGISMSRREHFHREHRWCGSYRNRCNYCIKNDIWKTERKKWEKLFRQRESERHERWQEFGWIKNGCDCDICRSNGRSSGFTLFKPFSRRHHKR